MKIPGFNSPGLQQSQSQLGLGVTGGMGGLCPGGEPDTGMSVCSSSLWSCSSGVFCALCVRFPLAPPILQGV